MLNNGFGNLGSASAINAAQIAAERAETENQRQMDASREFVRQNRRDQSTARAEAQLVAQTELLAALGTLSSDQFNTLAAMRKLSEDLAREQRRTKVFEEKQQSFNRRMSWAAILLAGAAVIVPFCTLLIEQTIG